MPALRDNQGKPELSFLLDLPKAVEALVKVFEQGAIKYARGNWKLGGKPDQEYLDSALRHLFAMAQGGPDDPFDGAYDADTGCLHAAHVIWNMAALIELNYRGNGITHSTLPALNPEFDQAAFLAKYTKPAVSPGDRLTLSPVWAGQLADGRNVVDL